MTQEDKSLLLKDLCARLPYGIKGNYQNSDDKLLRSITIVYGHLKPNGMVMTGDIKPYLFPLSSMTEEQKNEFNCLFPSIVANRDEYGFVNIISKSTKDKYEDTYNYRTRLSDWKKVIQWLLKNHFDIYGLIPMSLAIDATGLDIY